MFFSFPRWFAPSVDGIVLPDTPENLFVQGRFTKVPFIVGQTKDEGAFFYRLVMNSFNNGQYDDNFIDHKLPRLLPVISGYNSKLYPITRQVRKRYFVNVDLESEDEFRPRFVEVKFVWIFNLQIFPLSILECRSSYYFCYLKKGKTTYLYNTY
jgi:hypothetical protein